MQFGQLRRREFITLIGGAVAWPLAARAQQGGMRRIGILLASRPSDSEMQARVQKLQKELQRLGWTKGVNIQFDERWTTDDMELVRWNSIQTSSSRVVAASFQYSFN
jgi:putative tryptophan/tyrosine transport system substrate-binding protein